MLSQQLTLINKLGLHARAAMQLSELALRFASNITLTYNSNTIDAKNILEVMVLGATCGQTITVKAEGDDEQAAIDSISALVNARFNEPE